MRTALFDLARALLQRLAIAAGAGLLLCGCNKIGPDFHRPEIKLTDAWLDAPKKTAKAGDFSTWWKLFHDPILDRLIEKAYRQNLDVQKAAIRIYQARAQLGIAKGYLFPQKQNVGMDTFYERISEFSPYYQGSDFHTFTYFQTGFDAMWELDIWGRFRRGIDAAGAEMAASTLEYDDMVVTMTAEVAAAYVQIRTFHQRLALARGNADLQERSFRIAESQFRNGLSTELDMQQAKALRQATLAEIASLEVGLRQSKNALSVLLGMQPNLLEKELGPDSDIPAARSEIAMGIPTDILRRRPDVRAQEYKAASQCAQIGIAESELLPRLSLVGTVGFNSGSIDGLDVANAISPSGLAGKFGPTVIWPIFQYGRLTNNVRVQDAKFQELLTDYRSTVLRALREVENAIIAFKKAEERVASLEDGVRASQRAAELALRQYQNGLEDYTRVLNSELFLVQQQDRLTASRGDVARSVIAMYKALGGGWELREGRELLPPGVKKEMRQRTDWNDLLEEPVGSEIN